MTFFKDIFSQNTDGSDVRDEIIFVSDFFVEQVRGGAELTSEALIKAIPKGVHKYLGSKQTPNEQIEFAKRHADKIWIFGNFSSIHPVALQELKARKTKYFILEYDYKFCQYRSPQLHKIKTGKDCDCHIQPIGKFISNFYTAAQHLFFMSAAQRQEYENRFPELKSKANSTVLSSVWEGPHLNKLVELRERPKNNKWAVLSGGSWIKAEKETVEYCKSNGLQYELIGNLPYEHFVSELSKYKGLVFHPAGWDTCPRLVIEAKLMGLELDLNENVQHKDEPWFSSTYEEMMGYLSVRQSIFWNILKPHCQNS